MRLFRAVNMNWSCHGIGDWAETVYFIQTDGSYVKTIKFSAEPNPCYPDEVIQGKFSRQQFKKLTGLLSIFPNQQANNDCCDGDGWEMTLYGEHGKIVHKVVGYIYEEHVLEEIAAIMP